MFFILLFICGSCIGSFLNVVIYRLPLMVKNEEYNQALDFLEDSSLQINPKFNLAYPSSHCPQCKKAIPFWANIPIIGYFITKMRCYYCKGRIPCRYPLVEFITAILFFSLGYTQPNLLILGAGLVFISIMLCAILIDVDGNTIPNTLILLLLWLGIIINTHINFAPSLTLAIVGAVSGYILPKIFLSILAVKSTRSHSHNNIILLNASIGSWFGYIAMLKILIVTIILSILYKLVFYKKNQLNYTRISASVAIIYLFYLNGYNLIT
jgi:leader peptidase (prepilin peptidase) / N-methyltransferase